MSEQNKQTASRLAQAISAVGDRVIDWMSQRDMRNLHDENQALRLAASQARQNETLISALRPMPIPAYPSCNPWAASYGNTCACGGTWG